MEDLHFAEGFGGAVFSAVPTAESAAEAAKFLALQLERQKVPGRQRAKLQIALDEIYSNILRCSGARQVRVEFLPGEETVTLIFRDDGRAFDPLSAPVPDIAAPAEERAVGGLGIHMVRHLMDRTEYRREDGQNIFALHLSVAEKQ